MVADDGHGVADADTLAGDVDDTQLVLGRVWPGNVGIMSVVWLGSVVGLMSVVRSGSVGIVVDDMYVANGVGGMRAAIMVRGLWPGFWRRPWHRLCLLFTLVHRRRDGLALVFVLVFLFAIGGVVSMGFATKPLDTVAKELKKVLEIFQKSAVITIVVIIIFIVIFLGIVDILGGGCRGGDGSFADIIGVLKTVDWNKLSGALR